MRSLLVGVPFSCAAQLLFVVAKLLSKSQNKTDQKHCSGTNFKPRALELWKNKMEHPEYDDGQGSIHEKGMENNKE